MATTSLLSRFTLLACCLLFLGGLFATLGATQLAQAADVQRLADPFSSSGATPFTPGFDYGSITMLSGWLLMSLGGLVALGAWLTAVVQAAQQRRWGWVATLLVASLLLDLGAASVWFPLFPEVLRLTRWSWLYIPLPALTLALLPLPVMGWSWTQQADQRVMRPLPPPSSHSRPQRL